MPGLASATPIMAFVTEVSRAGTVLFEAEINMKSALSTGVGWGQSDLVYRSGRTRLYPD